MGTSSGFKPSQLSHSFCPWMTLTTPSGTPASCAILTSIIQAPGSCSLGLITYVLPHTRAMGNICEEGREGGGGEEGRFHYARSCWLKLCTILIPSLPSLPLSLPPSSPPSLPPSLLPSFSPSTLSPSLPPPSLTHPERYHGREVEGGNSSANSEGFSVCVCVHVFGDSSQCLPELETGDRAGVFHHLCEGWGVWRW